MKWAGGNFSANLCVKNALRLKNILLTIGVGEGVAGRAAAPLVEQKFATFGELS